VRTSHREEAQGQARVETDLYMFQRLSQSLWALRPRFYYQPFKTKAANFPFTQVVCTKLYDSNVMRSKTHDALVSFQNTSRLQRNRPAGVKYADQRPGLGVNPSR
jgi:hypothetical protein